MEIIKKEIPVSGTKQFVLEVLNFLVNMVLIVIVMIIGNLLYFDVIEYSKGAAKVFNFALTVFFLLCLLFQNVFFRSLFYFITKHKIESKNKKAKIGLVCHNFMFNFIIIGTIVVQVCEVVSVIKLIVIILFILDFIPCVIKKYSKSLSCYIFKIETMKIQKKLENDGILL